METALGLVKANAMTPATDRGANRPGARRGNRHSSATLGPSILAIIGPSILAINKIGPVANKPGTAAMEEIGMASGTEAGAANGLNLFGSRTERTLTDLPNMPETSQSCCNGRRPSSDFCADKTGGGHSYSKRFKD